MFAILVWSGWMVASRYAVKGSLTAYDITAIRFTVGGLILLPVVLRKGLRIAPYGFAGGLVLSLLIGAPYTNIAVAGMMFAPASHASTVINGTLLIITTVVGIYVLREKTTPLRIIGVICSLAGIGCMLIARGADNDPNQWLGHILFVISGAMWAGYTLLVRAWKADALHAAAIVCVFSMILYLPFYLLFAQSHIGLHNWQEVAFQGFYQGLLTAVLALTAFNAGIGILGAARAGALIPLVPAISTLLAIPILHEIPTWLECFGVAAVSFGVFLASGIIEKSISRFTLNKN
jgi:drug/metabolite transporter (DMT)-like permease